jgi:hypothetical protein
MRIFSCPSCRVGHPYQDFHDPQKADGYFRCPSCGKELYPIQKRGAALLFQWAWLLAAFFIELDRDDFLFVQVFLVLLSGLMQCEPSIRWFMDGFEVSRPAQFSLRTLMVATLFVGLAIGCFIDQNFFTLLALGTIAAVYSTFRYFRSWKPHEDHLSQ